MRQLAASLVLFGLLAACGQDGSSAAPTAPSPVPPGSQQPTPQPVAIPGLLFEGDPESPQGATWTLKGRLDGVTYDLQGVLLKPAGSGPFAAVVVSHGAGGNAFRYSWQIADEMRRWGLVGIATNYTHASDVPLGAPGRRNAPGASQANVERAHAAREILRSLSYVDQTRVAAHGQSMGAFVTAGLVSAYPGDFRVASHTAGGVRPPGVVGGAPSEAQVRAIRTPYQMHHGDQDDMVLLERDEAFASILQANGVPHELHVYPGASHGDVANNATVLARVRAWYAAHQVP